MDDGFGAGFLLGAIVGMIMATFVTVVIVVGGQGSSAQQFASICDYENGVVKQDVCIVDGKVFPINTEDRNG